MKELDLNTRWDVITGGEDFFEVTKASTTRCTAILINRAKKITSYSLATNELIASASSSTPSS